MSWDLGRGIQTGKGFFNPIFGCLQKLNLRNDLES